MFEVNYGFLAIRRTTVLCQLLRFERCEPLLLGRWHSQAKAIQSAPATLRPTRQGTNLASVAGTTCPWITKSSLMKKNRAAANDKSAKAPNRNEPIQRPPHPLSLSSESGGEGKDFWGAWYPGRRSCLAVPRATVLAPLAGLLERCRPQNT